MKTVKQKHSRKSNLSKPENLLLPCKSKRIPHTPTHSIIICSSRKFWLLISRVHKRIRKRRSWKGISRLSFCVRIYSLLFPSNLTIWKTFPFSFAWLLWMSGPRLRRSISFHGNSASSYSGSCISITLNLTIFSIELTPHAINGKLIKIFTCRCSGLVSCFREAIKFNLYENSRLQLFIHLWMF